MKRAQRLKSGSPSDSDSEEKDLKNVRCCRTVGYRVPPRAALQARVLPAPAAAPRLRQAVPSTAEGRRPRRRGAHERRAHALPPLQFKQKEKFKSHVSS